MTETTLDVLCFGEALIDFFPSRPGLTIAECEVFHRHLGGAPANVAVGLGRLGARVGLMTLVGPDDFGKFVRVRLAAERVDVTGVGVHPKAKTGITFVTVATNGERGFLFFRHPSADQMISPSDVDERAVAKARILQVGSSTLSREPARAATWKAMAAARGHGRLISTDPNWRPHLWDEPAQAKPIVAELIGKANIVKVSEDELDPLVGLRDVEEATQALRKRGPEIVVVTLGEKGSYFACPSGSAHVPVGPVTAVDSTGAGDAFMAGLLHSIQAQTPDGRRLSDLTCAEVEAACQLGNRLGAEAVTRLGAT